MSLSNLVFAAMMILAGVAIFTLTVAVRIYARYRGKRIITCPETKEPAAVHVNAVAAAGKTLFGKQNIRLDQCSRWPERQNCGQDCLSQIKADPEQCLVWNMVDEWYEGKSCAYCQKPFGQLHWHDHPPALLTPERLCVPWNEVPPEKLPEIFQAHLPVCWNCYIAETFRRQNPGRVVERQWDRGPGGEYTPKEESASAGSKPSSHKQA